MTVRYWGILYGNRQQMMAQHVVEVSQSDNDFLEALDLLSHHFDLPRPLVLPKHLKEMSDFGRTAFKKEHFMETIKFVSFSIQLLQEQQAPPRDPRIDA